MSIKSEKLRAIQNIPESYNQYFTQLSTGKPQAPDLPEMFSAQELGEELMGEIPEDFGIDTNKINDLYNIAKIGFAYIKLENESLAARFSGIKRINTVPKND